MQLPHTEMKNPAIGIFDSGIGGLSVLHEIRTMMPEANLIYIADTAYLPYGTKSEEDIEERAKRITTFLISQGAVMIVVACNTATAAAATFLRETFDVPIIGMEPAIKPAASLTETGVIAVLATENTTKSSRLAALTDRYAHHIKVLTQPCHGLVELVENNEANSPKALTLLDNYISPLMDAKADVLILGCTHYPFLKPAIHQLVRERMKIIDTGNAVARHTQSQFLSLNITSQQQGKVNFYCTGDAQSTGKFLSMLWESPISCNHIKI